MVSCGAVDTLPVWGLVVSFNNTATFFSISWTFYVYKGIGMLKEIIPGADF